jgi:hypothetical protein
MNRQEAIAALMSIPEVAGLSVANIAHDDVIVVEWGEVIDAERAELIRAQLEKIWPQNKIVVTDGRTRLKIVKASK